MFDLLIVGGGIHGTLLQLTLKRDGFNPVVVDSNIEPLAEWNRNTRACGMRYLRSSSSHGLELDFHGMRRFARNHGYGAHHFIRPYMRPSLELFRAYTDYLIESEGLAQRLHDRIITVRREDGAYLLEGERERYRARRVILAVGSPEPRLPWSGPSSERAHHVFDPRHPLDEVAPGESVAIVGAGVTGGQLAVSLAERGAAPTVIEMREPRQADYDGNPCYVGPRCAGDFDQIGSAEERRRCITAERYPGTLPRDIYEGLSSLRSRGAVAFLIRRVEGVRDTGEGVSLELATLDGRGESRRFDRVVAATGFAPEPPMGDLVRSHAAREALALGPLGYPFPQANLEWGENLFLSGALAELRVGPPARNIIGAHLAARRILPALRRASAA